MISIIRFFLVISIVLIGTSVFSAPNPSERTNISEVWRATREVPKADDEEPYDTYAMLEEMFKGGKLPKREELIGWTAGRCYINVRPREVVGALLVGFYNPVPDEPMVEKPQDFKLLYFDKMDPEWFDTMSPDEDAEIDETISKIAKIYTNVGIESKSYLTKLLSPYSTNEDRVRSSGPYLVSESSDSIPFLGIPQLVYKRCFFHKKIK